MAKTRSKNRGRSGKKRASVLIACRAFYDTDRDLVDWWESLPFNQRSELVRGIIRASLASSATPDFERMMALLNKLDRKMESMDRKLNGAVVVNQDQGASDVPRLSEEEAQKRLDNILSNEW